MEIVYKSPIVLAFSPMNFTRMIPANTAIREPGIFLLIFGHTIRIARDTIPTHSACQFIVCRNKMSYFTLATVSIRGSFVTIVSPRKSLICPIKIVTAIPAVKPVVIGYGMNLISEPILNNPIKIRIIPASIVATTNPSTPSLATIPATIVANAAVGPEICTLEPPRNAIMNPPVIAV